MDFKSSLLLLLLLLTGALYAQETTDTPYQDELTFNVHGILSFPNSSFGTMSDDKTSITLRSGFKTGDKIGLAQTGFGIGIELNTAVWTKGMNWIISAKLLINSASGEEIQSMYRSGWGDTVDVEIDMGNWINLPLMTGLKYKYDIFNDFECYGLVQVGANFSQAPSLKATVGSETIEQTSYEFIADYAVELGVGIVFKQKYNLGVNYFNGGAPRYRGTRELNPLYFPGIFNVKTDIISEERSISMFTVVFGILF